MAKAAPALHAFFAGQKLTSGSSGWLAQAYQRAAQGGSGLGTPRPEAGGRWARW